MKNRALYGTAATILSAVIFGCMPIAAKIIYANGSNPLTLTFHRFLFGLPVLFLLCRRTPQGIPLPDRKQALRLGILALGYVGTPPLLFSSYRYISSGLATSVHFVYPVLVLLGCALFFRERIGAVKGLCCLLCMAGILCFCDMGDTGSLVGLLIAFASGVTYAFYILYLSRGGLGDLSPLQLGFYLSVYGSVALLALNLALGTLCWNLTPLGWVCSILFSLATSGVATVLFQMGVQQVGPQNASLLSTFEPLTSVVVGMAVFGERLSLRSAAGIGCILAAVVLLSAYEKRCATRQTAATP